MKGKRTDFSGADCAIARSLSVIGDWWSLLIVREAFFGRQRFGEFQKALGLAKNILSARLKKLVDAGIMTLEADGSSSAHHRYVLTEKGRDLHVVLVALWQWGEKSCFGPNEIDVAMVDSASGAPLQKLEVKASDGRHIGAQDILIAPKEAEPV